jgi:hypothetical protein
MLKPIKEVVSHRSCACGDYFTFSQCSCCHYSTNTRRFMSSDGFFRRSTCSTGPTIARFHEFEVGPNA